MTSIWVIKRSLGRSWLAGSFCCGWLNLFSGWLRKFVMSKLSTRWPFSVPNDGQSVELWDGWMLKVGIALELKTRFFVGGMIVWEGNQRSEQLTRPGLCRHYTTLKTIIRVRMSQQISWKIPPLKLTPENRPFTQKETSIPTINFQGRTVSFREGNWWVLLPLLKCANGMRRFFWWNAEPLAST